MKIEKRKWNKKSHSNYTICTINQVLTLTHPLDTPNDQELLIIFHPTFSWEPVTLQSPNIAGLPRNLLKLWFLVKMREWFQLSMTNDMTSLKKYCCSSQSIQNTKHILKDFYGIRIPLWWASEFNKQDSTSGPKRTRVSRLAQHLPRLSISSQTTRPSRRAPSPGFSRLHASSAGRSLETFQELMWRKRDLKKLCYLFSLAQEFISGKQLQTTLTMVILKKISIISFVLVLSCFHPTWNLKPRPQNGQGMAGIPASTSPYCGAPDWTLSWLSAHCA